MDKLYYEICRGCPESRVDSARVDKFLKKNKWTKTSVIKNADLILFRSCGLTEKEAQTSISIIKHIELKRKRDAKFLVWGCLPRIDPNLLKAYYVGETFDEYNMNLLNNIVNPTYSFDETFSNHLNPVYEIQPHGFKDVINKILFSIQSRFSISPNEQVFTIKVSSGCLGNCSFCAVRKSRGVLKSKEIEKVVEEFKKGIQQGYQLFSLLGTDLGSYGRDYGYNLADLLKELLKEKGDYKLGLRNVNPRFLIDMFEELKPIFLSGKIWFLSSAIESGSNKILRLMNRRYTVQDFKKCIKWLNEKTSNIFLRTQIIVGFPTETDVDFQKTYSLINELNFDWVEVYKFSPRKGTLAADMKFQISDNVKNARFQKLALKTMAQNPGKKLRQLMNSFNKTECERQDWKPVK